MSYTLVSKAYSNAETLKSLLGDDLKVKLDDDEYYYLGLYDVKGDDTDLPPYMTHIWWAVLDDCCEPITDIHKMTYNTSSGFAMELCSNFEFEDEEMEE